MEERRLHDIYTVLIFQGDALGNLSYRNIELIVTSRFLSNPYKAILVIELYFVIKIISQKINNLRVAITS